jgi:hypothetical protein
MVWLGVLGLAEFGGLWLTARCFGSAIVGPPARLLLAAAVRGSRRLRVERWIRVAPLLTVASAALLIVGVITWWANLL